MSDDAVLDASDRRNVSTLSWNATRDEVSQSWWEDVDAATAAKSAAFISVVLLALFGNGLVIAAVVRYRRLRSVTNHFVVSLALGVVGADLPQDRGLRLETAERGRVNADVEGNQSVRRQSGGGRPDRRLARHAGLGAIRAESRRVALHLGVLLLLDLVRCHLLYGVHRHHLRVQPVSTPSTERSTTDDLHVSSGMSARRPADRRSDPSCCTASILHLCVIAVERYLAIAHPLSYGGGAGRMTRRRALVVIAGVWACSAAISFAPIYAGWFADVTSMTLYSDTPADCGLHVNRVYAVVSSATSFYLPLVVMATVYSRIYGIARRQQREIYKLEVSLGVFDAPPVTPERRRGSSVDVRRSAASIGGGGVKEPKAITTLGILMGMFCVCWCPFFLVYVIRPFCPSCIFPGPLVSAIT